MRTMVQGKVTKKFPTPQKNFHSLPLANLIAAYNVLILC